MHSDPVSAHKRPPLERSIARAVYAVLRDDCTKARGTPPTYAELGQLIFGRKEASAVVQAMLRGTVPAYAARKRIRELSPNAAGLADVIQALAPSSAPHELRRLFVSMLADLNTHPTISNLAGIKDLTFDPGAIRAIDTDRYLSRFGLEVIMLRRLSGADTISATLKQGWYCALALIECAAQNPSMREIAPEIWKEVSDRFLPNTDETLRYGSLDLRAPRQSVDIAACLGLLSTRQCLEQCVPSCLDLAENPIRVPSWLALEFVPALCMLLLNSIRQAPKNAGAQYRVIRVREPQRFLSVDPSWDHAVISGRPRGAQQAIASEFELSILVRHPRVQLSHWCAQYSTKRGYAFRPYCPSQASARVA